VVDRAGCRCLFPHRLFLLRQCSCRSFANRASPPTSRFWWWTCQSLRCSVLVCLGRSDRAGLSHPSTYCVPDALPIAANLWPGDLEQERDWHREGQRPIFFLSSFSSLAKFY